MAGHDGRYAPSPTGALHLGNLRTALLAWLLARHAGARFLLRIEDLDAERSRPEHEAGQLADLRALGLDWDGEPLRQSARGARYAEALARLTADGRTFPCWCTRRELREAASAPHGRSGDGRYPGTCRDLGAADRARLAHERGTPAVRLRAEGARATAHDRFHGAVTSVVDDVVLARGDGAFAYHLAVVVDDGEQGVDEVCRGDDLLDVAPTQAHLATLLGLAPPIYAHVPLVLGADGRRLAKRDGAVTLADQAHRGRDAASVRAALAVSVGLTSPGEDADLPSLLRAFEPARLRGIGPGTWDAATALPGAPARLR